MDKKELGVLSSQKLHGGLKVGEILKNNQKWSKIAHFPTSYTYCRDMSVGYGPGHHRNILRKLNDSTPSGLELLGMAKMCSFRFLALGRHQEAEYLAGSGT